jgi:hypothetical protein
VVDNGQKTLYYSSARTSNKYFNLSMVVIIIIIKKYCEEIYK